MRSPGLRVTSCKKARDCGDGIKNGTEACDDGKNDGSYGRCAPGCVLGPYCGDGAVQMTAGEVCDQGAANSSTAYGQNLCTKHCSPAPYCGDKKVDVAFSEGCDDGVNSGMPGSCTTDCSRTSRSLRAVMAWSKRPSSATRCRNGTAGSACDKHCKTTCGNGVVDPGETCDDGVDNGAYGTCTTTCQLPATAATVRRTARSNAISRR